MKSLTKHLSALLASLVLVAAAGCASTNSKEGTGEYFDDSVITTKVKASILDQPMLKVLEIKVSTFKGVVTLTGSVGSAEEIAKATDVARHVAGVKSVRNELKLK